MNLSLRKTTLALVVLGLTGLAGTGCNTVPVDTRVLQRPAAKPDIVFIDFDAFDTSMSNNMAQGTDVINVTFATTTANINELPERLQRWLSAIETHGGGISVETNDGYERKDLLTLVGLMASGYKLAKQYLPSVLSNKYRGKIVLAAGDGSLERIEFIRM